MKIKKIKGEYGYFHKKKIRQLLKIGLCALNIVLLLIVGYGITKTRNNLFTVLAILVCLPMANFITTYFAIIRYHSGSLQKKEEFEKAAAGLLTSYDMIITSKEMVLPVPFGVIHENGIMLYLDEKAKIKKLSDGEEYVTRMLLANGQDTKVHIFKDWQPFLRRVSSLSRKEGETLEKLEIQKSVLLAISI